MICTPLELEGAYLITLAPVEDERGCFVRNWCAKTFQEWGLNTNFTQFNTSLNTHSYTLRGLHYQEPPFGEVKLVQCSQGILFDVIVDLRPDSETYLHHYSHTLRESQPEMLYIPQGFAHGFLTLEENTQVIYYMAESFYEPEAARGLHWKDSLLGIEWPAQPQHISERDQRWESIKK